MHVLPALILSFVFVYSKLFARAQYFSLGEWAGARKSADPNDARGRFSSVGGKFKVPNASDTPGTAIFVGITFGDSLSCGVTSLSVGVFIYNFVDSTSNMPTTSYRPAYQLHPGLMHIIIEGIYPIFPGDPIMTVIIAPRRIPNTVIIANNSPDRRWAKVFLVPLQDEWEGMLCDQVAEWKVGAITAPGVSPIPLPRFGAVNFRRALVITNRGDIIPAGHDPSLFDIPQNDVPVITTMVNSNNAFRVRIKDRRGRSTQG